MLRLKKTEMRRSALNWSFCLFFLYFTDAAHTVCHVPAEVMQHLKKKSVINAMKMANTVDFSEAINDRLC